MFCVCLCIHLTMEAFGSNLRNDTILFEIITIFEYDFNWITHNVLSSKYHTVESKDP